MDIEVAARGFAAMGSEVRLNVLNAVIRAGEEGLSVGDIQARTGIAPSTLAHHLKFLSAAGLLTQVRDGRTTVNRAAFGHLEGLAEFIFRECCADVQPKAANHG